jgi:hypothetical protein
MMWTNFLWIIKWIYVWSALKVSDFKKLSVPVFNLRVKIKSAYNRVLTE